MQRQGSQLPQLTEEDMHKHENPGSIVEQLQAEFETLFLIPPWGGTVGYPWFTQGDMEAFTALFSDNVVTIVTMMYALQDLPNIVYSEANGFDPETREKYADEWTEIINNRIVPGLAFAIAFGNLWYMWMAVKLAEHTGRTDVCAQPFGVNTPAAFIFIYNVCLSAMFSEMAAGSSPKDMAQKVWMVGCSANFIGGIIETLGAFVAKPIQRFMSMAAIMGPIAGVGLMWLGFGPLLDIFEEPIIGYGAFFFAWCGFFGGVRYLNGMVPFTVIVILLSSALQWINAGRWYPNTLWDARDEFIEAEKYLWENGLNLGGLGGLGDVGDYMSIVFPIALNNFIGTMMVVESAQLAGDNYPLAESMVSDGLSTMVASLFGCVLPTTVYIGHPFYKQCGATRGYVALNGTLLFLMCSLGLMPIVQAMISVCGAHTILVCIGFLIVNQTIELTHPRHYPALFIALMPIIGDYSKATFSQDTETMMGLQNIALGGGILLSMMFTQISCDLIDRRYLKAALFCTICIVFSLFGILHPNNTIYWDGDIVKDGNTIEKGEATLATYNKIKDAAGNIVGNADPEAVWPMHYCEGWRFAVGYTIIMACCLLHHLAQEQGWIAGPNMESSYDLRPSPVKGGHGGLPITEEEPPKTHTGSHGSEAEMTEKKRGPTVPDPFDEVHEAE